MQRRFKINVDGREYDVSVVEVSDDAQSLYPDPQIVASVMPEAAPPSSSPVSLPAAGPGDVICPIAGVVIAVDVAVGADVSEGIPVITVEAMKMKTVVNASRTGKVSAIAVAVGDPVEQGQPLLTIV